MKQVLVILGVIFLVSCQNQSVKFKPVKGDTVLVLYRVPPVGNLMVSRAQYWTKQGKELDSNDNIIKVIDTAWKVEMPKDTLKNDAGKPIIDTITKQPKVIFEWYTLKPQENKNAGIQIIKI